MKILQVINSLATGGAEKLLLESIPKYQEKGIEMDLLVLNGNEYPFYTDFKKNTPTQLHSLGKKSVYNPIFIFKIIKYLKHYDILHVHLFPALYWVALAKWISFSKTKIVFTEHSTSNRRMNHWLLQKLDRFIYSKYNAIICITSEVENQLKKHLKLRDNRLYVIENGIDLSAITEAKKYNLSDLSLPDTIQLLIQVSSFQFPKDQTTVVKSLLLLPNEVHLLLVGQGRLLQGVKLAVQKYNLSHRVHFLGVRMDVPNLLKTADIVILSSQYEGLSLSCIEGMASGKPFIASDVLGLREMVGGSGLLFPFQDEKKLAQLIKELLEDKEKQNAVAQRCLIKAQQYDSKSMIDNQIKLYQLLQ